MEPPFDMMPAKNSFAADDFAMVSTPQGLTILNFRRNALLLLLADEELILGQALVDAIVVQGRTPVVADRVVLNAWPLRSKG